MSVCVRVMATVTGLMVLFGCATARYGTRLTPALLAQLERGRTTQEQVTGLLGHPRDVQYLTDGGQLLIYEATRRKGPGCGIVVKQDITRLRVTMNPSGIVQDYTVDQLHVEGTPLDTLSPAPPPNYRQ